jgi:hypothetical protein
VTSTSDRPGPLWWQGHDHVVASVPARTATHQLTWSAGVLTLDSHGDPESEAALVALGAEGCSCLDILEAWNAQSDQPEVLTVGRRSLADDVRADRNALSRLEGDAARWRTQWAAAADDLRVGGDLAGLARLRDVAGRAERRLRVRLGFVRLLALGDDDLIDRLQLTVLAAAEQRWASDDAFRRRHRARLHAALISRALPPLTESGLAPADRMQIEMLDPGAEPVLRDGRVALPLSWLTNVWGRGVAAVSGRFVTRVVAIEDEAGGEGGKVLVLRGVDGDDWRYRPPRKDHR